MKVHELIDKLVEVARDDEHMEVYIGQTDNVLEIIKQVRYDNRGFIVVDGIGAP